MKPEFMAKLQKLRETYGAPMRVTSGYRCPQHIIEVKKARPGAHASGQAVDIGVQGSDAHTLLRMALEAGFTGIGVQQKGTRGFLHLDTLETIYALPFGRISPQ
jgi:zinc D-Ala-D-Ala carboxypeptidase